MAKKKAKETERRLLTIDGDIVIVKKCEDCPLVERHCYESKYVDEDGEPEDAEILYSCNHPKFPETPIYLTTKDYDDDGTFPSECPLKKWSDLEAEVKQGDE